MSYTDGLEDLIGQYVEIYCGQTKKTLKLSDFDISQRTVVRGKLVDMKGDCLIVECEKVNSVTLETNRNKIYINTWGVTALCHPDDSLSLIDMFVDEHKKQTK